MWKVIKCAVQGIGHIDKGIPCQDKVYSLTANDVTTIALADGCGSSKLSHYGAETITKFICEKFCNNFDVIYNDEDGVNVKKQIINDILEQWSILAQGKECEIKDLRSTLLFVSVKGNHYILTHIGDGILGYLKGDELKVALMPKKEGAANETFYPDSSVCLQIMQLIKGELNTINGFVLLSDGTEASLYDKRKEQLADIIKKLMSMCDTHRTDVIEKMLQLSFESTIKQQTTDDCSIVFMYDAKEDITKWQELPSDQLIKLFELNLSETNTFKDFRDYLDILKLLTKKNCSLDRMYTWFHIKRKDKKDILKRQLQRLQRLQLIAEVEDNVYSLFIK